jgi:hypothetical protein
VHHPSLEANSDASSQTIYVQDQVVVQEQSESIYTVETVAVVQDQSESIYTVETVAVDQNQSESLYPVETMYVAGPRGVNNMFVNNKSDPILGKKQNLLTMECF